MSGVVTREIRTSLAASRAHADRVLSAAEFRARTLSKMAQQTDQAFAEARLKRLVRLRAEIELHQEKIEDAYVAMAEAMALAVDRLADAARQAEFATPAWPGGIRSAFELKLTETREMTIRISGEANRSSGPRLNVIEHQERKRR